MPLLAMHEVLTLLDLEGFSALRNQWDQLRTSPSPFLTSEWLAAWWQTRGRDRCSLAVLRSADGRVRAGALVERRHGRLVAATDAHSGDWDAVADDEQSRVRLWTQLGLLAPQAVVLRGLMRGTPETAAAHRGLRDAGYRTWEDVEHHSPCVALPRTWEELLAQRSSNLRRELRAKRRALERQGTLRVRLATTGSLEPDLTTLLRLEASGWKGRQGTAILSDPSTEDLYRSFAREAAARGRLRLRLLELDGAALAGELGYAEGDTGFSLKTGYDETYARSSPGSVLLAEVLRESIAEGLTTFDLLGTSDPLKDRWTDRHRPRVVVRAYGGPRAIGVGTYRRLVRPALRWGWARARPTAPRAPRPRHAR